jgi:uncharacterized protein YoaH (UPF0181 family)
MFAGLFMARHEQQARAVAAMAEGGSQRRIVARPLAGGGNHADTEQTWELPALTVRAPLAGTPTFRP